MNAPLTPSMLQPAASTDWPENAVPESWIDSLFARMSAMYGAKFADLWRGTDLAVVRRLWGVELASVSRDELKAGVDALTKRPFPPTLPEFLSLCRPPVNYDAALYEAAQQMRLRADGRDEWSNPAFYWAAVRVGDFDMLNLPHGALIKRFTAALDDVLRGEVQPVPKRDITAIPAPGKTRAQPEKVQAAVAEAKALRKEVGNREWAKRILERQKRGEKMALAVVQMAKRALGILDEVAA